MYDASVYGASMYNASVYDASVYDASVYDTSMYDVVSYCIVRYCTTKVRMHEPFIPCLTCNDTCEHCHGAARQSISGSINISHQQLIYRLRDSPTDNGRARRKCGIPDHVHVQSHLVS